jgi:hypothetical protein
MDRLDYASDTPSISALMAEVETIELVFERRERRQTPVGLIEFTH